MKIQPISKVNQKFSSYTFKDLDESMALGLDLIARKDKLYTGLKLKSYLIDAPAGHSVTRSFMVNKKIYIQYTNGMLYALTNNNLEALATVGEGDAIVLDVAYQGLPKKLIIDSNGKGFFADDPDTLFDFVPATSAVCYGGRLFLSDKSSIYFGKFLDYTDFGDYGCISIDASAGNILDLFVDGKELLVFCEYKVYTLNCLGSEQGYTLKQSACVVNPIRKNSIFKTLEGFIFSSGSKICVYKDRAIKEVKDLKIYDLSFNAFAFDGENYYVEAMLSDARMCVCAYSLLYDSICFTDSNEKILIAGGYLSNYRDKIIKINPIDGINTNQKRYVSKVMDLGTPKEKRIIEISLYTQNPITLSIKGDFGVKQIDFEKGYNQKKCNITSEKFAFTILAYTNEVYLSDMQVKFMVKGE